MCKFVNNTKHSRIDKCMKVLIENLKIMLPKDRKIIACCCGHKKYPMTILIQNIPIDIKSNKIIFYAKNYFMIWDLCSNVEIPRKRKFYKRDKQGYYFIPEILKCKKKLKKFI